MSLDPDPKIHRAVNSPLACNRVNRLLLFLSYLYNQQLPRNLYYLCRLDLGSHHALEASHVALLGGDLEVAVDDAVDNVSFCISSTLTRM